MKNEEIKRSFVKAGSVLAVMCSFIALGHRYDINLVDPMLVAHGESANAQREYYQDTESDVYKELNRVLHDKLYFGVPAEYAHLRLVAIYDTFDKEGNKIEGQRAYPIAPIGLVSFEGKAETKFMERLRAGNIDLGIKGSIDLGDGMYSRLKTIAYYLEGYSSDGDVFVPLELSDYGADYELYDEIGSLLEIIVHRQYGGGVSVYYE